MRPLAVDISALLLSSARFLSLSRFLTLFSPLCLFLFLSSSFKLAVNTTLQDLVTRLEQLAPPDAEPSATPLALAYIDPEGDRVTIATDADLREALNLAAAHRAFLRLLVRPPPAADSGARAAPRGAMGFVGFRRASGDATGATGSAVVPVAASTSTAGIDAAELDAAVRRAVADALPGALAAALPGALLGALTAALPGALAGALPAAMGQGDSQATAAAEASRRALQQREREERQKQQQARQQQERERRQALQHERQQRQAQHRLRQQQERQQRLAHEAERQEALLGRADAMPPRQRGDRDFHIYVDVASKIARMSAEGGAAAASEAAHTQSHAPAAATESVATESAATESAAVVDAGIEQSAEEPESCSADDATHASDQLDAAFVADVTVPDGSRYVVGSTVHKMWTLRNTGTTEWPQGLVVAEHLPAVPAANACAAAPSCLVPSVSATPVFPTPPGGVATVHVVVHMPQTPGRYRAVWRLRDLRSDQFFGDRFWCDVVAISESEFEAGQRLHAFAAAAEATHREQHALTVARVEHESAAAAETEAEAAAEAEEAAVVTHTYTTTAAASDARAAAPVRVTLAVPHEAAALEAAGGSALVAPVTTAVSMSANCSSTSSVAAAACESESESTSPTGLLDGDYQLVDMPSVEASLESAPEVVDAEVVDAVEGEARAAEAGSALVSELDLEDDFFYVDTPSEIDLTPEVADGYPDVVGNQGDEPEEEEEEEEDTADDFVASRAAEETPCDAVMVTSPPAPAVASGATGQGCAPLSHSDLLAALETLQVDRSAERWAGDELAARISHMLPSPPPQGEQRPCAPTPSAAPGSGPAVSTPQTLTHAPARATASEPAAGACGSAAATAAPAVADVADAAPFEPAAARCGVAAGSASPPSRRQPADALVKQLVEMGFTNRDLNRQVLSERGNDVGLAIEALLALDDAPWNGSWSATRH